MIVGLFMSYISVTNSLDSSIETPLFSKKIWVSLHVEDKIIDLPCICQRDIRIMWILENEHFCPMLL